MYFYKRSKVKQWMYKDSFSDEVARVKEHKEVRREYMTLLMELQKSKREGVKGRTVIINLLKLNMPVDSIADATDSPIPYVKEIAREAGYSV